VNKRVEKFTWLAVFKDNSELSQYPEGTEMGDETEETNFRQVIENQDQLKTLKLITEDGPEYSVDLETGEFKLNGVSETPTVPPGAVLRPINVRRIRRIFDQLGQQIRVEITHILGWQTTVGGKNYKTTIQVKPDGKVELSW